MVCFVVKRSDEYYVAVEGSTGSSLDGYVDC